MAEDEYTVGVGIGVMLLHNQHVLLGKRHAENASIGAGTWSLPGGKLAFGEEFVQCAYRETLEESGIAVDTDRLQMLSVANDVIEGTHFVTIGYLCTAFEGEPTVKEPEAINEWQWFHVHQLPDTMFPPSKTIVERYKALLQQMMG